MVTIELNPKDAAVLADMLQSLLVDLRAERVRTDNREFHADLVQRETFLSDLINRLEKEKGSP